MSILINRCGVSYTYDNPRPDWITEEGWYTNREEICNALGQFPDWKLETYPPFAGETISRVALCAEVEALRDVLDEKHIQLLLDEEYLAVSVRSQHWGNLDAGCIKLTAFRGRSEMERFVEKYKIVYEE